jgi:hypothetical protein
MPPAAETTPIKVAVLSGATVTLGGMIWLIASPHSTLAAALFAGGLVVTFVTGFVQKAREVRAKRSTRPTKPPV